MLEVFLLSFALSMDAFAVSIGLGVKLQRFNKFMALKIALFFGFFQALMPLFGYLANIGLGTFIAKYNYIVAFVLLFLIGAKMLYESFQYGKEEEIAKITNRLLLILAIATSIDALAAGFTLDLLDFNPFLSIVFIGIITFIFSFLGTFIGTKGGTFFEDKAEKIGGIILIFMAFKILIENLI